MKWSVVERSKSVTRLAVYLVLNRKSTSGREEEEGVHLALIIFDFRVRLLRQKVRLVLHRRMGCMRRTIGRGPGRLCMEVS